MATNKKTCVVTDCMQDARSNDLCNKHYLKLKKYGDPNTRHYPMVDTIKHPLYYTWRSMRSRCNWTNSPRYKDYGGRGIQVCDRWQGLEGFMNFVEDMGDKPSSKHSVDRIDNDGNYEPSNCRWATREEQQMNKRVAKDNNTGVTGVGFWKEKNLWRARIRRKTIGYYHTFEEAASARFFAETFYDGTEGRTIL